VFLLHRFLAAGRSGCGRGRHAPSRVTLSTPLRGAP
jgi:hypothetical protein